MAEADLNDQLRRSLVSAWHQYLVALDPIRPDLFRYCRRLTGNLWDAEDLVQETLLKAFGKLSHVLYSLKSPRAYLLRIASNLWIDNLRSRATEQASLASGGTELATAPAPLPPPSHTAEMRDAAAQLLQHTAPQERAALLLVEIFDMTIEETADILGTTVGATKSALHRARTRLKDADTRSTAPRPRPSPELLDRFVDRYNARDLPALLALMRDDATIEMHGFETEIGREGFTRERGWFHHNFYNPVDGNPTPAHWQIAEVENVPVVLVFGGMAEQALTSVMRIEDDAAHVRRVIVYALCPDVVREVGAALGLPTQTLGYHFPFDVSAVP